MPCTHNPQWVEFSKSHLCGSDFDDDESGSCVENFESVRSGEAAVSTFMCREATVNVKVTSGGVHG